MPASVNKVMLLGNLGADPEIKNTGSITIGNLRIATSRKVKLQDGTYSTETEWHRAVLFGRAAELAQQYLKKGSAVFIEGRLRTRKWTDQNGIERRSTEIVADNMQFVGGKNDAAEQAPAPAAPAPRPAPATRPTPNFDESDVPF